MVESKNNEVNTLAKVPVTEGDTWVPYACCQCGMGPCPARAHVVNGVVIKVEGDPNFKDKFPSSSLVCAKSIALPQKIYNPYRVKNPMKRTNPKKGPDEDPQFVEISWDEAYDMIVNKLKEIRAKGIVNEQGVPRVCEANGNAPSAQSNKPPGWEPFWTAWGITERMGGGGGIKCYHEEHVFGELWHRAMLTIPDFPYCNYVIMFGRNQNATTPQLGASGLKAYADARVRGMKHVHISPDLNVTGARADEWIPIKIKTDSAFLYSMIHIMLYEMDWRKECDIPFLKQMTNSPYLVGAHGYYVRDPQTRKPLVWDPSVQKAVPFDAAEDFALEGTFKVKGIEVGPDEEIYQVEEGRPSFQLLIEHVKNNTPEWAARITDVPAETIRRLTQEFVKYAMVGETITIEGVTLPCRPVDIHLGRGVNNGWGGYQCVWAQHIMQMLVGALEVPGGNLSTHSVLYMFTPIEREPDGFLLYFMTPTDKKNWQWPPKFRHGWYTLTPLATQIPDYNKLINFQRFGFGFDSLNWKSCVEPVKNWPSSIPDFYMFGRSDPVPSQFDSNLVRKVMSKIGFTVHIAYTMCDTDWYADVILPEAVELENYQLEPIPGGHKGPFEWGGLALRQPVTKPALNIRDGTDIFTELADRLGMLEQYNTFLGMMTGTIGSPWALDVKKKYNVEEIMDHQVKAYTKGEHDLAWFKKNGMYLKPIPKLHRYMHVEMTEKKIRYQLPYQEATRRMGEQLVRRVHEVGLDWWYQQAEEYTHGLPVYRDFRKPYQEVYEEGKEYDVWTTVHCVNQLFQSHNADLPWNIEASEDGYDTTGILINPVTAKKKGIKTGDRVCLESKYGKSTAKAVVSETVAPDVVTACAHFGRKNKMMRKLAWASLSETERMDFRITDENGSSSMHTICKLYKVQGEE